LIFALDNFRFFRHKLMLLMISFRLSRIQRSASSFSHAFGRTTNQHNLFL
jgi:hypothetical protein